MKAAQRLRKELDAQIMERRVYDVWRREVDEADERNDRGFGADTFDRYIMLLHVLTSLQE